MEGLGISLNKDGVIFFIESVIFCYYLGGDFYCRLWEEFRIRLMGGF